ncbi:glycosyltransferase [Paenibacillus lupini]|uniref:glycosyltransferase n=1 Tax=Paenibacillus lupini TaxID=1450204 RepID=UPI00141EF92A|nr:glycosyltransferase [Paenibacillus lupini]NIK23004.1 glycosyltransferase involved in cell wall biosynthesis [Paenibacillus lupini]
MSKPFTIVVCTYNGSRFISLVIEALLKQNNLHELVHEIMIVDNKSTDNTKDIILEHSLKHPLINYCFEEKQGLSNARRHASKAQTDWVIFVDDDNLLQCDWLIELQRTIEENPNAGVINGAVIACCIDELTNEELHCLHAMYHNLACTHLKEEDIKGSKPNLIPMGAGMCVKVEALKVIDKEGWLVLTGRTKNSLSSGEDTELSNRVFAQGYKYVCNYNMRLKHIIPASRLSSEYMTRLIIGLTNGRYDFISNNRMFIISRFLRCIKYIAMIVYMKHIFKKSKVDSIEAFSAKYNILSAKTFISRTKNDLLIGRN